MISIFFASVAAFIVAYGMCRKEMMKTLKAAKQAKTQYNGNDILNLGDRNTSGDNDLHTRGNRVSDERDLGAMGYTGFIAGYSLPAMDRRERHIQTQSPS